MKRPRTNERTPKRITPDALVFSRNPRTPLSRLRSALLSRSAIDCLVASSQSTLRTFRSSRTFAICHLTHLCLPAGSARELRLARTCSAVPGEIDMQPCAAELLLLSLQLPEHACRRTLVHRSLPPHRLTLLSSQRRRGNEKGVVGRCGVVLSSLRPLLLSLHAPAHRSQRGNGAQQRGTVRHSVHDDAHSGGWSSDRCVCALIPWHLSASSDHRDCCAAVGARRSAHCAPCLQWSERLTALLTLSSDPLLSP